MDAGYPIISRRTALGALAAGIAAAGCSRRTPDDAAATSAAVSGATGRVRIALSAAAPEYEPFLQGAFEEFSRNNPGIEIEPLFYPPGEYANAIQLSFTGGEAPDIYRLTGPSPATSMMNSFRNGWLRPMTEYLTDDFTGRGFPEGTFDSPTTSGLYIGDDLYGIPLESLPYTQVRILYVNNELLSAAGASGPPETWEEMADLAARITADGGDGTFGFAIAGQQTVVTVDALVATAGVPMTGLAPIDHTTGRPGASADNYVTAVELLRGMNADGVLTPGWETWDGQRPIQEFASGRLGMYVGANFHAAQIRALDPDLDFTLAAIPVPASGRQGFTPVRGLNIAYWGMSESAASPEAAWAVMDMMSTVEFQARAYDELRLLPALPAAYEDRATEDTQAILDLMESTQKLAPGPAFNGPDADLLLSQATAAAPTPNVFEIYTRAITEDSDYRDPAEAFDEEFDPIIDSTVQELQDQDREVERDDLAFPDWDPMEDYSA